MYYQNSTYHPLGRRFSFARAFRFGVLQPYKDTVSLAFPAQTTTVQLIPLPERFFAGGGTSLRGFALNQAGPRDLCWIPGRRPGVDGVSSGISFSDAPAVYRSGVGRRAFLRRRQRLQSLEPHHFPRHPPKPIFDPANPTECQFNCTNELNYFAHTVGFGLRYSTPVGPIRIDLGFPINRPQFVAPICPNGDPTCLDGRNGFQATRLPGFQIFFNLGSTF